jgi:DNA-binding winged helix-turn-helix (wHTH) protein
MKRSDLAAPRRKFVFGQYELLPDRRLLRRSGQDVDLAPKPFDALVVLVERAPNLVTKEELADELWPDTNVTDSSLSSVVFTLRQSLGDRRWVETIPKRGYQFVGEVQALADASEPVLVEAPISELSSETGRKLPFPGKRWFVIGAVIISLASCWGWYRLAGRPQSDRVMPLVSKYIQTVPFTSDGFGPDEEFVPTAITHTVRRRLESLTQSWPPEMFRPWEHTIRTGHVLKHDGSIVVDVQLLDRRRNLLWSDRCSQPYPNSEPLIGDVIGEHLARLLEQRERRVSLVTQSFDAVRDFSVQPSPQSPWKYGQVRDWSGIGFEPLGRAFSGSCDDIKMEDCWSDGKGAPDQGVIGRTRKTEPNEFETIVQPPDALWMTTGSRFTCLRWVAPADGRYSVHGRIRVADTVGIPCRVRLTHNTVRVLIERRNFRGFGSTIPVDFPDLAFTQGAALDVIFGPEIGVDYLSIDVQLSIRPVARL